MDLGFQIQYYRTFQMFLIKGPRSPKTSEWNKDMTSRDVPISIHIITTICPIHVGFEPCLLWKNKFRWCFLSVELDGKSHTKRTSHPVANTERRNIWLRTGWRRVPTFHTWRDPTLTEQFPKGPWAAHKPLTENGRVYTELPMLIKPGTFPSCHIEDNGPGPRIIQTRRVNSAHC